MNAPAPAQWLDANQRLLAAEFAALRRTLGETTPPAVAAAGDPAGLRAALPEPSAIDQLTALFGLSSFERSVLLLAAGVEMDATLARLVPRPSFGVALAALPGAHWSATTPLSPLRAWRLVELDEASPTQARLRIDERILHYLAGINQMDARLLPLLRAEREPVPLSPRQRSQAAHLLAQLAACSAAHAVVQLHGDDVDAQRGIAAEAAAAAGRVMFALAPGDVPVAAAEQEALAVLWQREAALLPAALLIDVDPRAGDGGATLQRFIGRLRGLVFVASRDPILADATLAVHVDKPAAAEQLELWQHALGTAPAGAELQAVASQFRFSAAAVERQAAALRGAAAMPTDAPDATDGEAGLWRACRELSRPRLDELALRIEAAAGWDDLILPAPQLEVLHQLAGQVRRRAQVHAQWGFEAKGSRGLGISALFSGESGVGKTMACEVLARELELDLYRIDLSSVVSKYIGETEKNLRRVFDAAEDSGAILLFDEADALFGKRSEVKDSHDRYANIEVSYLLQRMEAYRGLAVLTSNQRSALDPAFLRRLRFVVPFPFPDLAQREAIWRRAFPAATPQQGLDFARLARLQMAGGHIRNIALNAAFLAAAADSPVTMAQLARAAQQEAAKIDRPLAEQHTRGWLP